MTRASVPQRAFNAGEIAPLLWGRIDYQRTQSGLRACNGFLPLVEGGFTRAPGTTYLGVSEGNLRPRLIPFEFATNDAVVLEFTPLKMRVWRYGVLVQASGSAFELTTPYAAQDLENLQAVQSADRIYIADGRNPVQRLSRFALDNWTIEPAPFTNGPFLAENLDDALTLQASAETGTITLTASSSLFEAGHVGCLFQVIAQDYPDTPTWTGNTTVTTGDRMRYDGKVYEVTAGTNTGVNPPIHIEGIEQTDNNGIKWAYLSDGIGIVRVTAVASATSATATVIARIPPPVVTAPTARWAEGAWSDLRGYPRCLEFFSGRLVAAGTPTEPRTLWFSTLQEFLDFKPGTEDDASFAVPISGSRSLNSVLWLRAGKSGLHVGALGQEFSTRSSDAGRSIGPITVQITTDAEIGSRAIVPIAPDGRPIFVARDGRRVFEMGYSFEEDSQRPIELSRTASHLGFAGYEELVWQDAPYRIAWLRRGDGRLVAMIHNPQEEVLGWAPLSLAGGEVQSMAVSSSADGSRDVVTVCVKRQLQGVPVFAIEELADIADVIVGAGSTVSAHHLFCAARLTSETATATWSVPHLAGQTVEAWSDIGNLEQAFVAGDGSVTFAFPCREILIGLFDAEHEAQTLDIVPASRSGDPMGRPKRAPRVAATLHRTCGGVIDVHEVSDGIDQKADSADLLPDQIAVDRVTAYSGQVRVSAVSGMAREIRLGFRPQGGAPMTVLALSTTTEEAGI